MFDALRDEKIINKVGGRFALSTLLQKRLVAIKKGARELVPTKGLTPVEVVFKEIMEDKISLNAHFDVEINDDAVDGFSPLDFGPSSGSFDDLVEE